MGWGVSTQAGFYLTYGAEDNLYKYFTTVIVIVIVIISGTHMCYNTVEARGQPMRVPSFPRDQTQVVRINGNSVEV